MKPIPRRGVACALAAVAVLGWARAGSAAGMFLAPRGVRPLSMAGAYVAGARDPYALNYNPAGLADADNSIVVDAALPLQHTTYTCDIADDPSRTWRTQGAGLGIPSPTLAATYDFNLLHGLQFGLSLGADYPAMQNFLGYTTQQDAPERYGASDYRGTALVKATLGAGYRINRYLAVGASAQLLAGKFSAINVVSVCDGAICTQPENPSYDATVQVRSHTLTVPGGQVGVNVTPRPWLALGLAWESGYSIDQAANLTVRLPTAPLYAGTRLDPTHPTGRIALNLPWQLRAGARASFDAGSVELAYVYEPWRINRQIGIKVDDARVVNIPSLGSYPLPSMQIAQNFVDTYSVRLGGEYGLLISGARRLRLRAGLMYEPSAVPPTMLTPMTVDLDTLMASLGVRYQWGRVTFEVVAAHLFMLERTVTQSEIKQLNAVASESVTSVGNGTYRSNANIFGFGAQVAL